MWYRVVGTPFTDNEHGTQEVAKAEGDKSCRGESFGFVSWNSSRCRGEREKVTTKLLLLLLLLLFVMTDAEDAADADAGAVAGKKEITKPLQVEDVYM